MNTVRTIGGLGLAALLALATPAAAQEFDGPGSAVCGLVNFAFCPQPAPPPPALPDPNALPARAPMPAAAPVHRIHHRHHRGTPNG